MTNAIKDFKDFVVHYIAQIVQKIWDLLFFIARAVGIVLGEFFYFIDRKKKDRKNKNLKRKGGEKR